MTRGAAGDERIGSRRRRRPRRVGLLVLLVLALGSCGIPTDDSPRPLAEGATTTDPTPEEPADSRGSATLYLSAGGENTDLVAVRRELEGEASVGRVLEALLQGETEEDTAAGYVSLIPPGTAVEDLEPGDDGLLTIGFSDEWGELQGESATGAYGQVVLTVTELAGVKRVTFLVAGEVVPAPTSDQGNEQQVVTRASYRSLEPG